MSATADVLPEPAASEPGSPTIAGDFPDPDAATLDSLVESHATPAPPTAEDVYGPLTPSPMHTPGTRLMTRSLPVESLADGPVMMLPADPDRTRLIVWVWNPDYVTRYVHVADDRSKLEFPATAVRMNANSLYHDLTGHTGPLWVGLSDVTTKTVVSVLAVTS